MKRIDIGIINHDLQRYDTCGDWFVVHDTLFVRVSDQGDWQSNFLIAAHELIEAALCLRRGIKEENVTEFDKQYEKKRQEIEEHLDRLCYDDPPGEQETQAACGCQIYDEPGDDPHAPYKREHQFAETIERLLANELEVDWNAYLNNTGGTLNA